AFHRAMTILFIAEFGFFIFLGITFKNVTSSVRDYILIADFLRFKIINKKAILTGVNTHIDQKIKILIKLIFFTKSQCFVMNGSVIFHIFTWRRMIATHKT